MQTYRIKHYENDGFNNTYEHHSFEAENIDEAEKELKSYVDCSDPIFVDYDEDMVSYTFDIKGWKGDDEYGTETWWVEIDPWV